MNEHYYRSNKLLAFQDKKEYISSKKNTSGNPSYNELPTEFKISNLISCVGCSVTEEVGKQPSSSVPADKGAKRKGSSLHNGKQTSFPKWEGNCNSLLLYTMIILLNRSKHMHVLQIGLLQYAL